MKQIKSTVNMSPSYDYNNCSKEIKSTLDRIIEDFKSILQDNLTGIYLHGSLAMNCFNPVSSDIDFLVIVKEKLELETKKKLIKAVLEIIESRHLPEKELEFSVILEKYLKDFVYPTPFELHYSKDIKEKYMKNLEYICGDDEDKDLAAHITTTYYKGVCLYGEPIKEVFQEIPEKHYISSILYDLEGIEDRIQKDPVYLILNLLRILYYLTEKVISSKDEAGSWGLNNISEYKSLIQNALSSYRGEVKEIKWNRESLLKFSGYMMKKINLTKNKNL